MTWRRMRSAAVGLICQRRSIAADVTVPATGVPLIQSLGGNYVLNEEQLAYQQKGCTG